MGWLYSDAWAAGFFDGEGNVYLRKRSGRRVREVHAQLTQKDRRPLEELQRRFGGSLTETKTPSGCYRWRVANRKAEAFFNAIFEHSIVKRSAIRKALDERAATGPWGGNHQ